MPHGPDWIGADITPPWLQQTAKVVPVEKQRVMVRGELPPETYFRNRVEARFYEDELNRRLVQQLWTTVAKGPEKKVQTFTTVGQEVVHGKMHHELTRLSVVPDGLWQYVKAEVVSRLGALGRWWLRRWPVEVRVVGGSTLLTEGPTFITNTTNTTNVYETRTCHHLEVDKHPGHHLEFLTFERDNPAPPPRPRPYCPVCGSPPDHPYHGER